MYYLPIPFYFIPLSLFGPSRFPCSWSLRQGGSLAAERQIVKQIVDVPVCAERQLVKQIVDIPVCSGRQLVKVDTPVSQILSSCLAKSSFERRPLSSSFIEEFSCDMLASCRLLNLGGAPDHPSFEMSCSFTVQVLAQLDLLSNVMKTMTKDLDEKVLELHFPLLGAQLTVQNFWFVAVRGWSRLVFWMNWRF